MNDDEMFNQPARRAAEMGRVRHDDPAARGDLEHPSPAAPKGREDEGQRCAEDMSASEMSDKYPAGRDRYGKLKRHSRAGRDTPREKLDVPLTVRLSVSEREAIGDRARVLGVTKSVWARAVMRDALDARRSDVQRIHDGAEESPHPALAAAVEQVRRLGINVNQALKRSQVIDDALLAEVVVALDATRAALGDRTRL